MRVEQVTGPVAYHGEGPVWSERWGGLRWVDMLAGDVLSLAADGEVGRRRVCTIAAALRPRSRGGAFVAVERGFVPKVGGARLVPPVRPGIVVVYGQLRRIGGFGHPPPKARPKTTPRYTARKPTSSWPSAFRSTPPAFPATRSCKVS